MKQKYHFFAIFSLTFYSISAILYNRDAKDGVNNLQRERRFSAFYELRRPECDILRDKIYELRLRKGRINYRILYTFVGENVVLLSHGCCKKDKVPEAEIDKAVINRRNYLANPSIHTFKM